jgi:hypothetical protein
MPTIISVTHQSQDPILGTQPPVTYSEVRREWEYDERELTDCLVRLFRRFELPNGGTLTVEGYWKTIQWEHGDFLVPLARELLS